nr:MAG TPA: hypothetical protein [Caudoviricetes sp.]
MTFFICKYRRICTYFSTSAGFCDSIIPTLIMYSVSRSSTLATVS